MGRACTSTAPGITSLYDSGFSNFAFGTGDFTIRMWIRPAAFSADEQLIDFRPSGQNGAYVLINMSNSANGAPYVLVNSSIVISGTGFTADTWVHIALCRSSFQHRVLHWRHASRFPLGRIQQLSIHGESPNYRKSVCSGLHGRNPHQSLCRYTSNFAQPHRTALTRQRSNCPPQSPTATATR